jgi:NADPH2:quinone reductase
MRVVQMHEFGPPDVLTPADAPDPQPAPGQAVVRVAYASITFIETQTRAGRSPRRDGGPALPAIPGNGVGGTVTAVAADVDDRLIGRRVVTTTGGTGGYAEQVAVDAGGLIAVPDTVDLADAAALLADGRTAIGLIRLARPGMGDWVLVEAAGGGVGSLLVQLAANSGARVIGAAGNAAKRALARDLGAAVTVDYTTPGWTGAVRAATGGAGPTVAFDSVGGDIGRAAFEIMAPGGRFVIFGVASGTFTDTPPAGGDQRGVRVTGLHEFASVAADINDLTREALAEAAAGRLRPTIGQTFALDDAAAAHAAIEARTTLGKTLLRVNR